MSFVCGIVLAAGAGSRYGMPKALVHTADGQPWIHRAVDALRGAGCDPIFVALGCRADEALELVPAGAAALVVDDWHTGMSVALRAALAAAGQTAADAALVIPVDTPDLVVEACERIIAAGAGTDALRRAVYRGIPGHPVLIGREHWAPLLFELTGDTGAGKYLRAHAAVEVECSDLWDGTDHDRP